MLAQTPQAFRYEIIREAYSRAAADGFYGTDDASLAERLGYNVTVIMGSDRNIKITKPSDLPSRPPVHCAGTRETGSDQ